MNATLRALQTRSKGLDDMIASKTAISINHSTEVTAPGFSVRIPAAHMILYCILNGISKSHFQFLGVKLPGIHRYTIFFANKILNISIVERDLGGESKKPFRRVFGLVLIKIERTHSFARWLN